MKKVMIIQRLLPTYRISIFDRLAKQFDLVVLHTKLKSSIRQGNAVYAKKILFIKYWKGESNLFLLPFFSILKFRPQVIIHEASIGLISLPLTLILSKMMGIKFILWGHGYNVQKGFDPKSYNTKLRLIYYRFADKIILYGNNAKKKISTIIDENKLVVALNTLDTEKFNSIKSQLLQKDKFSLLKELNFKKKYNLIFLGRIVNRKNPSILFDILLYLNQKMTNQVCLHIIGDGPNLSTLIELANSYEITSDKLKFYGAIYDEEKLAKYLICCDILVNPGYVGLSIVHAFAYNCPVITFNQNATGPFHSPEIEYLINNETGFLVNSVDELKIILYNYLTNYDEQVRIKNNIENFMVKNLSIENMVNSIINAIEY